MNSTLDYQNSAAASTKVPLSERINLRIVTFIAVIGLIVGYPVYVLVDTQVSGGIKQAAGGYKDVNLKAMSTFTFDQENGTIDDVPAKWRALDGQKVILRGEMYSPNGAGDEVESFDLVYSIADCCVTSTPQVQHFIHSRPQKGAKLAFYDRQPVEARGILRVNVKKDPGGGKVASVFQFEVESVRPTS
ncbi:MAG TPA: hypothetical protein VER17_14400 [Tepidisphaeraceae bacterium]|nr:hypothetical protein [Tepidisphaeraceae bacterium]